MSTETQGSLEEQLRHLQEENQSLRKQIAEPDLRAFEQIRELRTTNKKLTDEMKRLTTETVQLAFKNRQLDDELKESRAQGDRLGHSMEELQSELTQSKEVMLSHEAELDRQKEELTNRQQQMSQLQAELNQREDRISKLENLVNDLKDQYLSGESFGAAAATAGPETGLPYQVMVSHMERLLGFAGTTVVDQVFQLSGADPAVQNPTKLEEVFDALQDMAGAFVRGTPQESELEAALKTCWSEIEAGKGVTSSAKAPSTPAAAAPSAAAPKPVPEDKVPSAEPIPEPVPEPKVEAPAAPATAAASASDEPAVEASHAVALQADLVVATDSPPRDQEEIAVPQGDGDPSPAEEAEAPEPDETLDVPAVSEVERVAQEEAPAPPNHLPMETDEVAAPPETEAVASAEAAPSAPPTVGQQKVSLINEGLTLVDIDPKAAERVFQEALELEVWVEEEAQAHLALARLKAGREPILEHLISCLPWVEVSDFFQLLDKAGDIGQTATQNLCKLMATLGTSARTDAVSQEGKLNLAGRSANRDLVSKIGYEEEEQLVDVLLEQILPKSGLKLALPGETWESRRENSTPAAFVGNLRQALRGVDYTLFDFHQLEVLSYDGEDEFLVDSTIEPSLGLMFHRNVETVVPEELRFLAFRRLVQMYRRYTNLEQYAQAFTDEARLALLEATIGLYEDEHGELEASLRDRSQGLAPGEDTFRGDLKILLRELYEKTELEAFLDLSDWMFGQELVNRRLTPMADHFASKVVGFTTASYATLRDELLGHDELFANLEKSGLAQLFQADGHGVARLRLQRFWAEALQASLG